MAVTTLDPKPALVVIDLQKGLMSIPTVHPFGDVVDKAARLAAAFRRHHLPVVLVNATGRAPGPRKRAGPRARVSPHVQTGPTSSPSWIPTRTTTW
jgi:nicotinamidase-related amidase